MLTLTATEYDALPLERLWSRQLAARRERHENTGASLILTVGGVVAVLRLRALLEQRNPAHEEQKQGDEHGPDHHREGCPLKEGHGVDE